MADIIKPDLCVIGAGALGIDLARRARQRGLSVALVETASEPQGDGPQAGLQRAAIMASAERAQAMTDAHRVGLDAAKPKPNFRAIAEHAAAVAASAAPRDARERLAALGVTLTTGPASFIDKQTLRCGEQSIRARQFALAAGSAPVIPALPGLDQVPFFTPDTILDNIRKLSHLVVIGGEPEAFELAQAYRRLGAEVTLVPQGGMLAGFDPELVAILLRALREEGVTILDDAEVTAIVPRSQGTGVTLRRGGSEESLDVSHILVAMGRLPMLDAELLDKARLRPDPARPGQLLVGPDGQTSNGRVTALGGAAGEDRPHVGARQAGLLIERLLGLGHGRLAQQRLPRHIATQPPLAQFGPLGTDKALRPGQTIWRSNGAEAEWPRANGRIGGSTKLVAGRDGGIVAAGAVGEGAGESVAMLALAATRGLKLGELGGLALDRPSTAAAVIELADQYLAQERPQTWWRRLPGAAQR